jgi:hypothetical protein
LARLASSTFNLPGGFPKSPRGPELRQWSPMVGVITVAKRVTAFARDVFQREGREALIRERDGLRSKSEESMRRAEQVLLVGHVPSIDPNYRMVMIGLGNIIFGVSVRRKPRRPLLFSDRKQPPTGV